ncbi:TonB-dependent receptor [uncultured Sphingomonas sp.]|uniref:TonB-dependent receptor n=1 Tax=uncultured Sphingomonas sp. TaxID=158754 RepID=UPI0035CC8BAB
MADHEIVDVKFSEAHRCTDRCARLGSVSLGALGAALIVMLSPARAEAQVVDQQGTGPTTNTPSSSDPAATQTPGGSTEVPTSEAGDTQPQDQVAAQAVVGQDEAGEDIVVTGFRAAIANSIAQKRNSDQILESISAEDIGKLPDNSIAESIARLPGVTAQRVDGRDQSISVRGFAPDFSTTLLNGREQVTTNDNRAVEFDQYPSELLGQVVVYKTPSAGLIGQGLSGTIDLRTIRPLQYGKRVFAANARGEIVTKGKLNAGTTDKGYRVSGTYIDQFANNTLGITIGVAHNSSPSQFERYNAWGYPTFDGNNALYGTQTAGQDTPADTSDDQYQVRPEFASAQGKFVLGGAKPFVQSNKLTRTGVVGTVEWEPTPELTTTLDLFYTDFKEEQALRGIELPLFWGNATLQPGYAIDGDSITAGTWNTVKAVVRSDYVERNAKIFSAGFNTKYRTGPVTLVGDASYSRVTRNDIYIETYAGTSRGAGNGPYDTLGFQTEGNGITTFSSSLDYADPNLIKLTSPQGWASGPRPGLVPGGQDGYYSSPDVKDELYALRGSMSYEVADNNYIELGGNFTSRTKRYVPTEFYLGVTANQTDPTSSTSLLVPEQYRLGTTDLSFLGIPGMVSFDTQALVRDGLLSLLENANASTQLNTWRLRENVATGWLRYNFNSDVGDGGSLTGNLGVQVVYTDQSSDGFRNLTGVNNGSRINDGRKYVDALPSLNMSLRFDQSNVLRVGIARTLARARMDQLKSSFSYGTNPARATSTDPFNAFFGAGGGNSRLKPWIATGVDISAEHYVSRTGYFALAGFYKYLETYIYERLALADFTGTPTNGLPDGLTQPGTFIGTIRQPVNGSGGILYGGEVSGTLPLADITSALDGFGLVGSYSYTKSNIQANPENPRQPLPGLSKHVASGTAFFEKAGFSARGSIRYRSGFLAEVISLGPGARNRLARGETIVDAQIGYEFQKGPLKGLGILAQGQNLTSAPFVTEDSATGLIIDSQDYGRRFLAGVAFKF